MKSGYFWAETLEGEAFIILVVDGKKGYVPGVENAIDLTEFVITGPVQWPSQIVQLNRNSEMPRRGAPAAAAEPACDILRFSASA